MIYPIVIILTIGALLYILYPLFQNRYSLKYIPQFPGDIEVDSLQQSKKEALLAIKEIDFEFQMGKLSQDDYENLKTDYQNQALQILREIDNVKDGKISPDTVEQQISKYRQKLKQQSATEKEVRYCPECGEKFEADYKYCISCGRKR